MDVFDSYFRRADLDQDGRISGQEAVAFCQGSNLPKPVLAQIWMHADQKRTGFLGRPEFYNFLKLVTVAQSGRQLTPDIVKAALHGPAAAKIPAPQINSVPPPAAQMNSLVTPTPRLNSIVPPSSQMGVPVQNLGFRTPQTNPSAPQFNPVSSPADQTNPSATPTSQLNSMVPPSNQMGSVAPTQNPGFRAPQANPSVGTNQQFFSSSNNQFMRPPGPTSTPLATPGNMASVHLPGANTPNLLTDWLGGRTTGAPGLGTATIGPITSSAPSKPLDQGLSSSQADANNSKALVTTGNGFSSDSVFGGDVFTLTSQSKPSEPSGFSSVTAVSQNSVKAGPLDSVQNPSMLTQGGIHLQWSQPVVKQNQLDAVQNKSAIATSNVSVGPGIPASSQSQITWPRITPSDVQKYTAVFVEVDKDRDGKISGEQARNLFLSWRLPREVLKQVWDLSDQDNDCMLSLREFCTALYLMERYREGRPLPAVLPNTLQFDETLLQATSQPSTAYSGPAWQPNPGVSQQVPGSRPPLPVTGIRPTAQYPIQNDGSGRLVQQSSRIVVPEKHLVNHVSREHTATNSKFQETVDAEKNELEILDYKEKIEFYRTKMQELVLYKSRCDNRLNEITERASADKREAESLGKKYEEKYKQVGEIASKLTVEEATYRDIQERKLELQNAIVKMEQGGSADGLLQVRADRIQSDLEELLKALGERCKQHGVHIKSTAMVELPFGWQPGIQEGAANWDEDWDKFEDDGFSLAKELTVDTDNDVSSVKPKPPSAWSDKDSTDEFSPASNIAGKGEKPFSISDQIMEGESAFDQSEADSARSASESPSRDFHSSQFGMHDFSPSAKTSHSDHGGAESTNSGDKFVDDPSWASAFDVNDDVDSVWGFKPANTKDSGYERGKPDSFFDSGELGLNPIKVDSPGARSVFGNEKKSSVFADSVPSTPFGSGLSPNFNEDRSFNSFSRFDSFSTHDGGLFPQRENQFSRFDSMRSTATDFDRGQGERQFSRFDSIMSTATDFDRGQGENQFARFDSIRSTTTTDFDRIRGFPSFDDSDPFGSTGPFKPSEGQSPRRGSDKWSAF